MSWRVSERQCGPVPGQSPLPRGGAEAANSKTLTSSIAQMTIGTAPPVMTTPTTRQAAATPATNTTAAAGSQPNTYAGSADVTTPAARSAVQMAIGSSYPIPLPPPGFPYLSTGYPPYWGMYIPLPVPSVCTANADHAPRRKPDDDEYYSDNPREAPEAVTEPLPSRGEVPGLLAAMYDDMPPLEGREDSDENSDVEAQGAVCTVAPVPKGRGYR